MYSDRKGLELLHKTRCLSDQLSKIGSSVFVKKNFRLLRLGHLNYLLGRIIQVLKNIPDREILTSL